MNDFTKEELERILKAFEWIYEEINSSWDVDIELKLQSMIDNYCEHDWHNSYCGCALTNFDCNKCGVILNDNQ